ncbi:hypothetical protein DSM104299_01541 [Baekduia alba]|uniref:DoxX family protein n=1 Tax=Baekduia alba TaxID=2997333 RepID=UPI0023405E61|nr:hypothetical protein [Baekduia alba]WCB92841.1 hypothetical protein DSM104299_01541 [Baekduia alba]
MTRILEHAAGPVFVAAGILHFAKPKIYESIMPDYLPAQRELVYASGVAEAAGGALLLSGDPKVRRFGAWWLVATLIGVFPANLHMALNPDRYPQIPKAGLYARLPLQLVFIRWVLAAGRR